MLMPFGLDTPTRKKPMLSLMMFVGFAILGAAGAAGAIASANSETGTNGVEGHSAKHNSPL